MDQGLTLFEVLALMKKRIGLITIVTSISLLVTAVVTFYVVEPKYKANTQLIVEGTIEPQNQAEINLNQEAIRMYQELIKSEEVINLAYAKVVEATGFYQTKEEFATMLEIAHTDKTPLFSISAVDTDVAQGKLIVESVVNAFLDKANELQNNYKVSIFSSNSVVIDPNIPKSMTTYQLIVEATVEPKTKAELDLNVEIISTYKDMIVSDSVITESYAQLKESVKYTGKKKEVFKKIDVTHNEQSQLFSVEVTDKSSKQAKVILDTVVSVFTKKANKMNNNYKVSVFSATATSKESVYPNKPLFMVLGGMVGIVLSVALVLILRALDKTIKDVSFIEKKSEYPLIGKIKL